MSEETSKMLEEAMQNDIAELKNLKLGSEEHSKAVEGITKLYKLKLEEAQNERASIERSIQRGDEDFRYEVETRQKEAQLKEQAKDRIFKFALGVLGLGVTIGEIMFYGDFLNKGFEFEKTDAFSSYTFKDFIKHFKVTRR